MDQIADQVKARLFDKKYFVARGLLKASAATNIDPVILAQAGGAVTALYLLASSNAFFLANLILTAYPIACTYFFVDERPSRDHLLIYWAALMTLTTFDRVLEQIPAYYIIKLALLALFFMEPYLLAEKLEQLLNQLAQRAKNSTFKADEQKKMAEASKKGMSPAPEKPDEAKMSKDDMNTARAPSLQLSVEEEPKTARLPSVRKSVTEEPKSARESSVRTARGPSLRLSVAEEPKTAREPSVRTAPIVDMMKTARAPSLRAPVVDDETKTARAPSIRKDVEEETKAARAPSIRKSLIEEPKTAREPSVRTAPIVDDMKTARAPSLRLSIDDLMKTARQASDASLKVMPVEPVEDPKTAREPNLRAAPVVDDETKTARAPSIRTPVVEEPKTAREPSVRTAPIVDMMKTARAPSLRAPVVEDEPKTARAPSIRTPVQEEPKTARAPSIRANLPPQEEQKTAREPSLRQPVNENASSKRSKGLSEKTKRTLSSKSSKKSKRSVNSVYAMTPQQSYTTARSPATGLTDGRPLVHGVNPMLTDSSYKLRSEGKGIDNKDIGVAANLNDMLFFPLERIVFNAPFDYDNLTYHMRIMNNAHHNIAFAVKGNCIPRVSAFPPCGILTPKQKMIIAVTVRKFTYNDTDYNKDRICFEYVLVKDKTVKEFSHKLLEEIELKRRKNIQICYNP